MVLDQIPITDLGPYRAITRDLFDWLQMREMMVKSAR